MLKASGQIKALGSMAGASPDITLPTSPQTDASGQGPAVLFADVSKSMQLYEQLGDQAARQVIDLLLGLATRAVQSHGGRVVKHIGDEILAVLPNADAAARAACDLLAHVDACAPRGGIKPGMHVGFHAGTFVERDGEISGDAVNIASGLTAYAKSGQILTTSQSALGLPALTRGAMRKLGALHIGARRGEMEVEEISWRGSDDGDTTVTESVLRAAHCAATRLKLSLGGKQWTVGPHARHLSIGRDPTSDIVTSAAQASRNHGYIEYRNGGYFYADTSLNGSYVSFGKTGGSLIRRTQVLLSGKGVICFGPSRDDAGEPFEFHVESIEQ